MPASGRRTTTAPDGHTGGVGAQARVVLLRSAYRVAYHVIGAYARVRRPQGRGVKCVLVHGRSIVLVRHTYGPRRVWHVPGGGLHRGERTLDAASREMHEELGLEGVQHELLGELKLHLHHRPVTVGCTYAELPDQALRPDPVEIAEARFFDRDALPSPLGEEVRSLIALARRSGWAPGGAGMGE